MSKNITHEEKECEDRYFLAGAIKALPKAGKKGRNAPLTPDERVAAMRKVVSERQAHRIEGTLVDLFSASTWIKVHDALNEQNKNKLASLPVNKGCAIAFKLAK